MGLYIHAFPLPAHFYAQAHCFPCVCVDTVDIVCSPLSIIQHSILYATSFSLSSNVSLILLLSQQHLSLVHLPLVFENFQVV